MIVANTNKQSPVLRQSTMLFIWLTLLLGNIIYCIIMYTFNKLIYHSCFYLTNKPKIKQFFLYFALLNFNI